jgi:uncharacterized membrane protein
MSNLVVFDFDGIHTADEVLNKLRSLQKEYLIDLEDACVVEREKGGKIHIKQAVNLTAMGAAAPTSRTVREWPRAFTARRLVLLATVASLSVAGLAIGQNGLQQGMHSAYPAESAQRPAGFADLVEKVKPAVISVRVR